MHNRVIQIILNLIFPKHLVISSIFVLCFLFVVFPGGLGGEELEVPGVFLSKAASAAIGVYTGWALIEEEMVMVYTTASLPKKTF